MHKITRFSFPTIAIYGPGASQGIPTCLDELNITKPLVVTDAGLIKTQAFTDFSNTLTQAKITFTVFSNVQPNPTGEDIAAALTVYQENGCNGIIGLGGGSPLDAAKALALLVSEGGVIEDYDVQKGYGSKIKGPLPPIIAVPTTAGTGSEVGKCAVITSSAQHRKIMVCHPQMLPKRAVLDPCLTTGLPAHLTAATGMDALTHNIESLTSPDFNPLCDGIALKGIELVVKYLEKAIANPDDLEARGFMMIAAMMGAIAFQKDLGAAHSLSHALSAVGGLQHGLANAICLVPVMRFNLDVSKHEYASMAPFFGIHYSAMKTEDDAEKTAAAVIAEIARLNKRIGIPGSLQEAGVSADQLPEIADTAYADPCHATNPKPCTRDDLLYLLKEAHR